MPVKKLARAVKRFFIPNFDQWLRSHEWRYTHDIYGRVICPTQPDDEQEWAEKACRSINDYPPKELRFD